MVFQRAIVRLTDGRERKCVWRLFDEKGQKNEIKQEKYYSNDSGRTYEFWHRHACTDAGI